MVLTREEMANMYGDSLRGSYTGHLLAGDYLPSISKTQCPPKLIDIIMDVTEGFVSGCFPSRGWIGNPREELTERQQVFDSICNFAKSGLIPFYEGRSLPLDEIEEGLFTILYEFERFYMKLDNSRNRFLNEHKHECRNFVEKLVCDSSVADCDHIVFIANGGIEPALLASHYLEIEDITPIAFSSYRLEDRKPCLPFWLYDSGFSEVISGKNVLLVDDAFHRGKSSQMVEEYLMSQGSKEVTLRYVVKV